MVRKTADWPTVISCSHHVENDNTQFALVLHDSYLCNSLVSCPEFSLLYNVHKHHQDMYTDPERRAGVQVSRYV